MSGGEKLKRVDREQLDVCAALKMSGFMRPSMIFDFTQTMWLYKAVNSLSRWEKERKGSCFIIIALPGSC